MNVTGEFTVNAPRETVFNLLRDARSFVTFIEGVHDLQETAPDHYTAVFETRVAYMKFRFNVTVEVVRFDSPGEIEAKIEGTPHGLVGRLTAKAITKLEEAGGETKVTYVTDATLTGKLGSIGQPVLRAKAKEMERQFASKLRAHFEQQAPEGSR
jgi:carbon monoxide dehydrogenase subunit G